MVHSEEDETSAASQRVREETRGSAARALGHEQEYKGHFGQVQHTRSESNNNGNKVYMIRYNVFFFFAYVYTVRSW